MTLLGLGFRSGLVSNLPRCGKIIVTVISAGCNEFTQDIYSNDDLISLLQTGIHAALTGLSDIARCAPWEQELDCFFADIQPRSQALLSGHFPPVSVTRKSCCYIFRMQMVNQIAKPKHDFGWKKRRLKAAHLQNLNFGK